MTALSDIRVLIVGVGGLGAPATRVLVESGVRHLTLLDDDRVEISNLQRQILFSDDDVGKFKTDAAKNALEKIPRPDGHLQIECVRERLLPENAKELVEAHDLVVEGADNYATKFLANDACVLSNTAHVSGGALRFDGWAFASFRTSAGKQACLRCLFEAPPVHGKTCDDSGVLGPVVGVVGALQAMLATDTFSDPRSARLAHYDGLSGRLRFRDVARRIDCHTCNGTQQDLDESHYLPHPNLPMHCIDSSN